MLESNVQKHVALKRTSRPAEYDEVTVLLKLSQLNTLPQIDKVIIHSIDLSLYQMSVELDGAEYYITDNKGDLLRAFNILDLQKKVRGQRYSKMVLRQISAYDEMIGMPNKDGEASNALEVEIKDNDLN